MSCDTKRPTEIRLPDLGTTEEVRVLEVQVKAGDTVELDAPLMTLETDKAAIEVPSPAAGRVASVLVKPGDRVESGKLVMELAAETSAIADADSQPAAQSLKREESESTVPGHGGTGYDFDVAVIGGGPGGYTAAFRAADLGLKVALIERGPTLGGVCLNVGCIPSKALLHAAKVIEDAAAMSTHGIQFGSPAIDAGKLRSWKDGVIRRLTDGLATLAKQRSVTTLRGTATFDDAHTLSCVALDGTRSAVSFAHCIVAAGSESVRPPGFPDDTRIIDSTGALDLELTSNMLVVGGGIIGLEMATVYDALGVDVSIVEMTQGLMPGCDRDLVRPLEERIAARYEAVLLGTKVIGIEPLSDGLQVTFEGPSRPATRKFDKILCAVGRAPNGRHLGCEAAGVRVDERGHIPVDRQMRTSARHIFAIGDVVGQPMLAHKATHEGKVAAEVIAGHERYFDALSIPSVAYTDPEIAWCGLTEIEAKAKGVPCDKGIFPWAASGRSLALGRDEGMTKVLFDPQTHRVLGGGIVGTNAGDLISEMMLAIEMGADATDLGLTIHPHPTLSETIAMAAEAFDGSLTDLYIRRRSARSGSP